MKEYRDKLQKLAEQGKMSPLEYWHLLVITYQLMDSEGKEKEYKKLQGSEKCIK